MGSLTLDQFIEYSQQLISARPDTTRITTTYTHKLTRRHKNPEKVSKEPKESPSTHKSQIHVKTYDPVSGTCFRVTVTRVNELGRVLSALGPRGITSSITKELAISTPKDSKSPAKEPATRTVTYEKSVQGLASAMLGHKDTSKVVEIESAVNTEEEDTEMKEEPKKKIEKKKKR